MKLLSESPPDALRVFTAAADAHEERVAGLTIDGMQACQMAGAHAVAVAERERILAVLSAVPVVEAGAPSSTWTAAARAMKAAMLTALLQSNESGSTR
jgi:hypothetical protein